MFWNQASLSVCINMSDDIHACEKYVNNIDAHLYSTEKKVNLKKLKFLNTTESHKVKKGFWCKFFYLYVLACIINSFYGGD